MSDEAKPLEFSARDLMPDWAQDSPRAPQQDFSKRFAQDEGDRDRRGGGGRRDDRRGGFSGPRGGGGGGGDRRDQGGRPDRGGPRSGAPGGPGGRGGESRGGDRRGGGPGRGRPDRDPRDRDRDRPREEGPPADVTAMLEPSGPAIEGLTRHLRETFRSFAIADLAKTVLNARERYQVRFTATEDRKLFICAVDGSLWLSREEAINHLLGGPAMEQWYAVEDIEVEAPSGNYNVVAVCGLSGTLLGPPNHHEYQRNIARLHRDRFSDMSLERFKSRIQMESGEEVITKWKEQISRVRQYRVKSGDEPGQVVEIVEEIVEEPVIEEPVLEEAAEAEILEGVSEEDAAAGIAEEVAETEVAEEAVEETEETPAAEAPKAPESVVLKSIEELARHFRQNFADEAVFETRQAVVPGSIAGRLLSPGLLTLLRLEGDRMRRGFPIEMIQLLCRDLEKKGLKFFKRGKKSLHVSAVRPKPLDETVTLTENVQRIVDYVKAQPKANVTGLLEALVPGFKPAEGPATEESPEWSEPARVVLKDLRWLTSEGFLLEFPDSGLAIGRQNVDKPNPATAPAKTAGKPKSEKGPKPDKTPKPDEAATAVAVAEETPLPEAEEIDDAVSPLLEQEEADPSDPNEKPESVDPVETV